MRKTTTLYLTLVLLSAGLSLAYGAPEKARSVSRFCEKLMDLVCSFRVVVLYIVALCVGAWILFRCIGVFKGLIALALIALIGYFFLKKC